MLLDIHTHDTDIVVPGESIVSVEPPRFMPVEGVYYSVGIHPWRIMETVPEDWDCLQKALSHPMVCAVGEAGLDKLTEADMEVQKEVFIRQILLSEAVGKPLIIHCVRAFNELVELKRKYHPRMPWVVHGFRNNLHIARRLMDEGIYFSLGERYQAEVLRQMPLDRLLTETDVSTLEIHEIIRRMAAERGIDVACLCEKIDENARRIFFRQ